MSILVMTFFIAMVTLTVSRSRIMRPFREWLDKVTTPDESSDPSMLYELVRCPFCFSFWVTAVTMGVFPLKWAKIWLELGATNDFDLNWWRACLLYGTTVWGLACIVIGLITLLFNEGVDRE